MSTFWTELKRRNVVRVAIAYSIVAWLLLQLADVVLQNIEAPVWVFQVILLLLVIGLPLALVFAWAFELTPEGIKLEREVDRSRSITHKTGRKLDFIIIGVLAIAVVVFALDKFVIGPKTPSSTAATNVVNGEITATETPERSIAVLPFVNMSADPEQEFFSDGISEELLNTLAQLPELRVAARTSSFQFKGRNQDIAEIADVLNVAHVLEGSVRKSGSKIRITAQLIKADDGYHMWSESYDRELDDIFAVQEEIATAISDALQVKLALNTASDEQLTPTIVRTANTDAYEAYLRGRQLINQRGRLNLEESVRHLERSLRLDNNFAPAHAQLAIATALLSDVPDAYGDMTLEEVRSIAIPHLDRAQELQPGLAEVYGGRALLALDTDDLVSAIEFADKAVALNPSYADAMLWAYYAKRELGRYHEIEPTIKRVLRTDPMSIIGRSNYALWLGQNGQIDEGHKLADELIKQDPWNGYIRHAQLYYFFEGDLVNGFSWLLRAHSLDPRNTQSNSGVVSILVWVNEYAEARRISSRRDFLVDVANGDFDKAIRATQRRMQADPVNDEIIVDAANVLFAAGRIDEALPHYERARELQPEGRLVGDSWTETMRLAHARQFAGDIAGAKIAAQIVRRDLEAFRAVHNGNQFVHRANAMLAAFDDDTDGAIAALRLALNSGHRNPLFFADPMFENYWDLSEFISLQQDLDAILAADREEILQLICFNNPVPDHWQPLPETCESLSRVRARL